MNKQSLKNGLILVAILVATSLVAVLWPTLTDVLSGTGGGSSSPTVGMTTVTVPELTLPLLGSVGGTEMNALLALGIVAGAVIAVVVGAGAGLALLYTLLDRVATTTTSSANFVEARNALEQRQKEVIKALNQGRTTTGPNSFMPRWSAISTSLSILFFVVLFAMVVSAMVSGQPVFADVVTSSPIVWGAVVLALLVLVWRVRPQAFQAAVEAEAQAADQVKGIPWDAIAIIVTGLLVVGIGIALVLYFNPPA